jgi:hypothetical protein
VLAELSDEDPVLPLIEPASEFFCESIECESIECESIDPLCEWLAAGVCVSCVVVPDVALSDEELPDIEPF